jgi:hypothetical protein
MLGTEKIRVDWLLDYELELELKEVVNSTI